MLGAVQPMPSVVGSSGFDYSNLTSDVAGEAKAAAGRIKGMRGSILEVGADLRRIKERLPHGEFGKWLKAEFGMTERSAQNYMAAAGLVEQSETVSVLRPKTLYLLSAPSTPAPVREDIVRRFSAGEVISDRAVEEMVDAAKFEQKTAATYARHALGRAKARRSRAACQAAWARERQEAEARRTESKATAESAVKFLLGYLPADQAGHLERLVSAVRYPSDLAEALLELGGVKTGG